jgi:hypothetical protein
MACSGTAYFVLHIWRLSPPSATSRRTKPWWQVIHCAGSIRRLQSWLFYGDRLWTSSRSFHLVSSDPTDMLLLHCLSKQIHWQNSVNFLLSFAFIFMAVSSAPSWYLLFTNYWSNRRTNRPIRPNISKPLVTLLRKRDRQTDMDGPVRFSLLTLDRE